MSDAKQLKFQFTVDEASLQKTRALIRDLTGDLVKLAEAASKTSFGGGGLGSGGGGGGSMLSGMSIGGGSASKAESAKVIAKTAPAGRQLVQGFLDQKNIFKGIADGSKDAMRVMKDSLHQAIDYQKRELKDLDNAAKHLVGTYDELGQKMSKFQSGRGSNWQAKAEALGNDRNNTQLELQGIAGERAKAAGELARLEALDKNPGGGGSGGGGLKGLLPKRFQGMGGLALGVSGALALGQFAVDETMQSRRGQAQFEGQRGSMVQGLLQRSLSGDVKNLFALQGLDSQGREQLNGELGGVAYLDQFSQGVGQMVAHTPLVGGLLNQFLGIGSHDKGGGMFGGFDGVAQDNAMMKNALTQLQGREAANPLQNLAMDGFSGSLGARISAQRLLGMRGVHTDEAARRVVDPYGELQAKLQAEGYSVEELASAKMSLQGQAGSRYAAANAGLVMAANSEGLAGFGGLVGAAGVAGGGRQFALNAIGGGIDRNAGVMLGSTIIGSGFDPRGTTNGMGVLAAAMGGMGFDGTAGDFRRVHQVGAGLAMGDSIVGGGLDAYQGARNLVGAINRLGPGADTYAQDFLANGMSMKQMIDLSSGADTKSLEARVAKGYLGAGYQGVIRGQLDDSFGSIMDRYVDQHNGEGVLSGAIQKFRGGGSKNLKKFLKGLDGDEHAMLADFYGRQTGLGLEAGDAGLRLIEGSGSKSLVAGGVGVTPRDLESEALKGMAASAQKVTFELEKIAERLSIVYSVVGAVFSDEALLQSSIRNKKGSGPASPYDVFNNVMGKVGDASTNAPRAMPKVPVPATPVSPFSVAR